MLDTRITVLEMTQKSLNYDKMKKCVTLNHFRSMFATKYIEYKFMGQLLEW